MRKAIIVPVVAGAIGFGLLAAPLAAHADTTPGTTTTFSLSTGMLTISDAASTSGASLTANHSGVVGAAATATGNLGELTVTDNQGNDATWTASVASTPFEIGTDANTIIPVGSVAYTPNTVTGQGGLADPTFTAQTAGAFVDPTTPAAVADDSGAMAAVVAAGVDGNNTASWTPSLTITLPSYGAAVGQYSGTITHSVI
jgi:hypothetical protein